MKTVPRAKAQETVPHGWVRIDLQKRSIDAVRRANCSLLPQSTATAAMKSAVRYRAGPRHRQVSDMPKRFDLWRSIWLSVSAGCGIFR